MGVEGGREGFGGSRREGQVAGLSEVEVEGRHLGDGSPLTQVWGGQDWDTRKERGVRRSKGVGQLAGWKKERQKATVWTGR